MADTVVLIHGAWLTPSVWDRFRQRYEAAGMTVIAPPWPCFDRPIDALRARPDPRLARLGLRAIVDHHAALVEALPHPPILIGHGFGGLVAQLLLDRGLGAAGVAIASAPPFGVAPRPPALWTALPTLFGWNRVLRLSQRSFSHGFAQTLPAAEKSYVYEKFVVPAPGRIFVETLFGIGTRLRGRTSARAPLLLIAGAEDRTAPPGMVRANHRRQRRAPSVTAFHLFPGRSHWLCNERGWEDVADRALGWAVEHTR
ncbi:alpha/beta hydrolase [Sphingomonas sp. MMS12-HWE2-04]|uniref:alpha/beta hydrolase n=1 Tax=Sphingomonas sp. MMS12-HWE2-04 TaxID=3234199 RepID=UPI00384FD6BD